MNSEKQQPGTNETAVHKRPAKAEQNELPNGSRGDLTLILVLLAVFIFHSPFTSWWSSLGLPWYSIFLFWLLLIVMLAIHQLKKSSDDSGH